MGHTGAQVIAEVLHNRGVDTVFGLPGVHNIALWPACAAAGVRIVGSRHEQGCAYAADGYARATGNVGVALTTTGPGAANTLGAVGEAWASHSPVVVIASDIATTLRRPGTYRGVLHECTDQAALFAPVTKARLEVGRADALAATIGDAITLARRAPSGPVYVGVPTDLLAAPVPPAGPPTQAAAFPDAAGPMLPLESADAVMELLAQSRRPLLWIGGGARDAGDEIDRVAHALGAPVVATFQARGVLPASHPLLVGAPPHEPAVTRLVEDADFVLVIGSDLDFMNTMGWKLPFPEARAAINVDEADATKNYAMQTVLEADARQGLRPLRVQLSRLPEPRREPWVDVSGVTRAVRDELLADAELASGMEFVAHTRSALPDDAVVFADMCIAGYWLAGQYPVERERGLHYPMGWGTLGFAFPAAIGAAVGAAPVVAVMGDGGMLFAIGELATVAQERLPLTIVVVDDGGYGMLRWGHEDDEQNGCDLSPVDFVAVARGFGITAERVDGLGVDYARALEKAAASREPRLIHVTAQLVPPRTTSPRWPLNAPRPATS